MGHDLPVSPGAPLGIEASDRLKPGFDRLRGRTLRRYRGKRAQGSKSLRVAAGCHRANFGIGFGRCRCAKLRFELLHFAGQSLKLGLLLCAASLDAKKRVELLATLTQSNLDLLAFGHS